MAREERTISERVISISNDLYSQGIKPSVRLVLAQMPDVKSTSAIHKSYADWRRELDAKQPLQHVLTGLSGEFTELLMKEINRLGVETENRCKDLVMDADEQRIIAIKDLERAEDLLAKQAEVIDQLEKELKSVKSDIADSAKAYESTLIELRNQMNEQIKALLPSNNEGLIKAATKVEAPAEKSLDVVQERKLIEQQLAEQQKLIEQQKLAEQQKLIEQQKLAEQ